MRNHCPRFCRSFASGPPRDGTSTSHNGWGHVSAPASSPREIRWLLTRGEEELEPAERADRARLLEQSQEAKLLHQLVQDFLQMLRARQAERLNTWMQA